MEKLALNGKLLDYEDITEDIYCNVCDEQIDDGCLYINDLAYICRSCLSEANQQLED